jgi:hypothetical protein
MNTKRLPKEYVEAISPDKLTGYLESHGWKQTAVIEENEVVVYRHPSRPEADVLVPLTRKYADYLNRVADAIVTVGTVEQRPFWEVYMDMAGRYYVGPHTYSTTPQTNGSANGATRHTDPAEVT